MRSWDKFCLLMWKNWKLQLRRPVSFIVEMGIPILVVMAFLLLRYYVPKTKESESMYDPFSLYKRRDNGTHNIAYSPTNQYLNELMDQVYPGSEGKANASALEEFLLEMAENETSSSYWVGVQFDDGLPNDPKDFPKSFTINLRYKGTWYTESVFPPFQVEYGSRGSATYGGPPYYNEEEFTSIMFQLTNAIFSKNPFNITLPDIINMRRFPYPSYESDNLIVIAGQGFLFNILFMTAFLYACTSIVKSITLEKEKQLKESMKIMGLPTWLHWTAWFLQLFIQFFFVAIVMTIGMKIKLRYGNILTFSDWSLILVFFTLYVIGIITFCFALSGFFSKANRAASLAGIIWILTSVPYLVVRSGKNYNNIGAATKYFSSLVATSGMSFGFDLICIYESRGTGIQWNNIFETSIENNISFGGILLMMILDIFIYLAIALYIEQVFPGEFGVPKKWYFLFTKDYWCQSDYYDVGHGLRPKSEFFENEPRGLKAGIQIENLCKTFGAHEAVKNLTLNLYEDQITVLLGHNGAGKTTTMSMLTGIFPPSKGTAYINGHDIRTQIMNVRDSMGLCPQHNVLFDELTVREHLQFFCKLKGVQKADVNEEVDSFLKLLSLEDKADEKCNTLSGGMKRKLCVGIAICGNSKVIMLDEPTAGMDPTARRFIWEFLQKQKKGRTILLTTHFMDEADLLGDRIAIMSNGELKCCGSSFFLKKKYGTGYHLIIEQLPNCKPQNITSLLSKYIPHIKIESNAGTELTYLLPEEYSTKFPEMLYEIESHTEKLGIRSFGISLTDLEEVFMKVGTNESGRHIAKEENDGNGYKNGYTNVTLNGTPILESGMQLYINQVRAMASKKFLTTLRTWVTEVFKLVLPILYIITMVTIGNSHRQTKYLDARSFSLDDYDSPITLVEDSNKDFKNGNRYSTYLYNQNQKYDTTPNMTNGILTLVKNDPLAAKYRYIVAASFDQDSTPTAWFNNEPYHSVPLSLQLILNSYLQETKHQVNFVNFPIPKKKTQTEKVIGSFIMSYNNLLSLSLAASYIGNFYILFNIKERMSQAKHLQFVSGINVFIFWFVSLIADIVTFIVPIVGIVITFAILQPDAMSTTSEIGVMALLFFCFTFAVLPFMYLFAYFFTVPSTGYSRMFFLGFAAGFPAVMIVTILDIVADWSFTGLTKWILRFIPHYDFVEGVNHICSRQQCDELSTTCGKLVSAKDCIKQICQNQPNLGCCSQGSIFAFDEHGVSIQILMIFVIALITFSIIFLNDLGIFTYLKYKLFSNKEKPYVQPYVDEDVRNENNYVHSTPLNQLQSQYILVLKDLMKTYKSHIAVNGLNLTVKRSECFGLLGVNGAGKTTTFKMMTGDEMISFGDGWINGYSIQNQMKKVHRFIGYCPQFDALLDNLTARETLVIFSL
ncbi:hypothetical protein WA026_018950 [Henosepilachna vigintioctopunctata]|uniref:ABC transporter domain-containing protein n=1 Tax=Henosepilachna vigintioctopunctata TaxID=420089 RepID=A0AAW1UNL4_9CUCU